MCIWEKNFEFIENPTGLIYENIYGKNIYALIDIGDNFDGINLDDYDFYVDYFTYNTYFCGNS